ncbi:MAG TPA: signal recognition particle-docking protein FtsY [Lichenihabitans sp.]|jgi:fused signal recognition particle receptor|nr:signal recognition particle-docking protein FtsY [Lichenihabitans sp.]
MSEESRRPGFFRRLFGGETSHEPDEGSTQEPASDAPAEFDDPALDSLERKVLAEALLAPLAPDGPEPPASDTQDAVSTLAGPSPPDARPEPEPDIEADAGTWWTKLRRGLSRSSSSIKQGIVDVFAKRKLDATTLEDLEDVLIRADLGVRMASRIAEAVGGGRYDKGIEAVDVQSILAREVETVLGKVAEPLAIDPLTKPFVILVVGVNGSGKTTTIGKLAAKLIRDGKTVTLAAGDTFRAAAVEQLRIWGSRIGAAVVAREQGADAAGLAFDAVNEARQAGSDVLLIDTAGRLQNRTELMDELGKVIRVIRKVEARAPHAVLLVLDATVGQNALSQVEIFAKVAGVTGLVMTKLDGTARGGILVAIAERFGLPVHYIGVGEGVDDLEPFAARDFARAIAGLDE